MGLKTPNVVSFGSNHVDGQTWLFNSETTSFTKSPPRVPGRFVRAPLLNRRSALGSSRSLTVQPGSDFNNPLDIANRFGKPPIDGTSQLLGEIERGL